MRSLAPNSRTSCRTSPALRLCPTPGQKIVSSASHRVTGPKFQPQPATKAAGTSSIGQHRLSQFSLPHGSSNAVCTAYFVVPASNRSQHHTVCAPTRSDIQDKDLVELCQQLGCLAAPFLVLRQQLVSSFTYTTNPDHPQVLGRGEEEENARRV